MKLYLLRHGEAVQSIDDARRALSQRGREEVTRIASFLKSNSIKIDQIYHSSRLRAQQTAEIVQMELDAFPSVHLLEGLQPDDDTMPIALLCNQWQEDTMLVGHLPFLSRLAKMLVFQLGSGTQCFDFQTASILCLEGARGYWSVSWFLFPQLVTK